MSNYMIGTRNAINRPCWAFCKKMGFIGPLQNAQGPYRLCRGPWAVNCCFVILIYWTHDYWNLKVCATFPRTVSQQELTWHIIDVPHRPTLYHYIWHIYLMKILDLRYSSRGLYVNMISILYFYVSMNLQCVLKYIGCL